jgi:hypothetical protein
MHGAVVIEQRRGLGDQGVAEEVEVRRAGVPRAVRCLVLVQEEEGAGRVTTGPEPVEGTIGDDVGRVPFDRRGVRRAVEQRVVVRSLPAQHLIVIEARRQRQQVPLADHGGLVPRCPEEFGKGQRVRMQRDLVDRDTVQVAVLSGQDGRPARSADRVGHEGVAKEHPLARNAIEIRCPIDHRAVRADRLCGVIIGHDEHDVRALLLGACSSRGEREHDRQQDTVDGHEFFRGGRPTISAHPSIRPPALHGAAALVPSYSRTLS